MPVRYKPEKMKVAVGDVVMLVERVRDFDAEREAKANGRHWTRMFRDKTSEVEVTKVGRKYLYVGGAGGVRQFELDSGDEVVGSWREGSSRIFTNESLAHWQRRERAIHGLSKFSRTPTNRAASSLAIVELSSDNLSTEGLEELRDLLEREENR